MPKGTHSISRDRRGFAATAIAAVVFGLGGGLVGTSIASQSEPSAPTATADSVAGAIETSEAAMGKTFSATRRTNDLVVGPTMERSKPVALSIPSIGVESDVQYLGQTSDGALETPAPGPLYDTAAWYRYSPTPGSLGPAILYGHVDSAANGPSVFYRLGELTRGDKVLVTRADDSVAVFEVDSVERYAKDDFPTKVVYSNIDHAGLRILTCGGAFDDSTGHYLDNIVVFASLVGTNEI